MLQPKQAYWEELQIFQSHGDLKKHINDLLKWKWRSECDDAVNNKLHEIDPQLGVWPEGFRIIKQEERVLARVQIGHSHRFTPSF